LHLLPSFVEAVRHPDNVAFRVFVLLAILILLCLPASSGSLSNLTRKDLKFAGAAAVLASIYFLVTHLWLHTLTLVPYGAIVTDRGILTNGTCIGGRPRVIPGGLLILITLLALISFAFAVRATYRLARCGPVPRPFQSWVIIQSAFVALYFAGVVAHPSMSMQPFDRYLAPMLPLAILAAMYVARASSPSALQYAAFGLFAAFGIAAVHDYYALVRVCAAAANTSIQSGITAHGGLRL
jgi:hypothetical protein